MKQDLLHELIAFAETHKGITKFDSLKKESDRRMYVGLKAYVYFKSLDFLPLDEVFKRVNNVINTHADSNYIAWKGTQLNITK